jgi:hypothetical protein
MPGQGVEQNAGRTAAFHRKSDRPPIYTEAQLVGMAKDYIEQLTAQVQAGKSERLFTYLGFIAKCPKYSLRNRVLIASQDPEATIVRGYKDWEKDGFQVRQLNKDPHKARVEHGIGILAPHFAKIPDIEAEKRGEAGKTVTIINFYFPVYVFDVKHLTPESQARVPQFFTTIVGDYEVLYRRIVQAATNDGYNVQEATLQAGEGRGYSLNKDIYIDRRMASGNKVLTAIHEWTHGKLHWTPEGEKLDTKVQECHAAAVQYVVATHFGVPAEYSADYILDWGNDVKSLKAELDLVGTTAVHMMKAIHALEEDGHDHYDLAKLEPQRKGEAE